MYTTMLVKTKKDVKSKARALAKTLGLSMTDVVNASLRQFVANQGITIFRLPTEGDMYFGTRWRFSPLTGIPLGNLRAGKNDSL